jgi:hypothetical protein
VDEQAIRRPQPLPGGQRRYLCRLEAETEVTVSMSEISARGVVLATAQRPPLGSVVRLRHLHAGSIQGIVSAHSAKGVAIAFPCDAPSVAFALAVVVSGMVNSAS